MGVYRIHDIALRGFLLHVVFLEAKPVCYITRPLLAAPRDLRNIWVAAGRDIGLLFK